MAWFGSCDAFWDFGLSVMWKALKGRARGI